MRVHLGMNQASNVLLVHLQHALNLFFVQVRGQMAHRLRRWILHYAQ
jgi:hypothetical protein